MGSNFRVRNAALVALAVFAVGCENGTAPEVEQEFDTDAALADYEALDAALTSDDWAGIQALGGRTPFGASPAGVDVVSAMAAAAADNDDSRSFVTDLARRLADADPTNRPTRVGDDGPLAGPIISGWHRGTTFVYDPAADDYAPDLTRDGAPETGVRFIMYELDTAGIPIVEQENGYADLIDEGDGSVEDIVLRLRVVHMDATVLDYRTTLDHDATSGALTVAGFLEGDGVRLDFDLGVDAQTSGGVTELDITFEFGVDARDFSIVGSVSGIEEGDDGDGQVDVTVQHRAESIRVSMNGTNGVLDGTFYVNGDVFATVAGPEDDPVFLNAAGEPLQWNEFLVLKRIIDVVEDVFDFLEDLVDPVDEIVLLGIIL